MKKYVVQLTEPERAALQQLTTTGTCRARKLKRALILLSADEATGDTEIARQVRQRFVAEGLDAALAERPRAGKARKLDGRQEAHLVALACTSPPPGQTRWTLQRLAGRLVELGVVDTISDETVRRTLKRGM